MARQLPNFPPPPFPPAVPSENSKSQWSKKKKSKPGVKPPTKLRIAMEAKRGQKSCQECLAP